MPGVWADDGILELIAAISVGTVPAGFNMHLYTNNLTPTTSTVLADFTEATFTGYTSVAVSVVTGPLVFGHYASVIFSPAGFTISAGTQNIYGWYLTDDTDTILIASQRDPAAPVLMDAAGLNTYQITQTLRTKDVSTP
jgi:hypothetical protein